MPSDPNPLAESRSPVRDTPETDAEIHEDIALCLSGGGYRAMVFHLGVLWRLIPSDAPAANVPPALANVRAVIRSIPALAGISIALWASAANEMVNLVFGVWLSDAFGLKIAALAGASAVIGLAELGGEGLVATVTDRIGKPRAVAGLWREGAGDAAPRRRS